MFDCAGRSAADGALAGRELEAFVTGLGAPVPCIAGVYTRGEIGRTRGAKGDRNHVSSSLRSAPPTDSRDELLRRFVEAARRAQIVTIVNRARTGRPWRPRHRRALRGVRGRDRLRVEFDDGRPRVVGSYGLQRGELTHLRDETFLDLVGTMPQQDEGSDLLSVGARELVRVPFAVGHSRGGRCGQALRPELDEPRRRCLKLWRPPSSTRSTVRLGEERDRPSPSRRGQGSAGVIGSIADGVLLVDGAGIVQL